LKKEEKYAQFAGAGSGRTFDFVAAGPGSSLYRRPVALYLVSDWYHLPDCLAGTARQNKTLGAFLPYPE
jgi:hypothetical protein